MFTRKIAILVALLFVGCGPTFEHVDGDECGGWWPQPMTVGARCVSNVDCGDPGVCIAPICNAGACEYDNAPEGMSCAQCNVFGTCSAGVCLSD